MACASWDCCFPISLSSSLSVDVLAGIVVEEDEAEVPMTASKNCLPFSYMKGIALLLVDVLKAVFFAVLLEEELVGLLEELEDEEAAFANIEGKIGSTNGCIGSLSGVS